MLSTPAPFPQAGADAFLIGPGTKFRIIQRRGNDMCLLANAEPLFPHEKASGTVTLPLADLAASHAEATAPRNSGFSRRRMARPAPAAGGNN